MRACDMERARQRIFDLFNEAARLADALEDRGLATIAAGAAMVAAQPGLDRREDRRRDDPSRRKVANGKDLGTR